MTDRIIRQILLQGNSKKNVLLGENKQKIFKFVGTARLSQLDKLKKWAQLSCEKYPAQKTEKSISFRSINGAVRTCGAGAFQNPVMDPVGQLLGFDIQRILEIPQARQFLQHSQRLGTAPDAQDTFHAHNAACPHTRSNFVLVSAVCCFPLAERRTGSELRPVTHQAFALREIRPRQLHPLVLEQTFHGCVLLSYF